MYSVDSLASLIAAYHFYLSFGLEKVFNIDEVDFSVGGRTRFSAILWLISFFSAGVKSTIERTYRGFLGSVQRSCHQSITSKQT